MELPEEIVSYETMKASGPGGQNVNKRSTAVRLRVDIDELPLEPEEKEMVREHMPPRNLTKDGEILVECAETRSQKRNRERVLERTEEEIEDAIQQGRQKQTEQKRKKRIQGNSSGSTDPEEQRKERMKRQRRSQTTGDFIEQAMEQDPDLMEPLLDGHDDDDDESSSDSSEEDEAHV